MRRPEQIGETLREEIAQIVGYELDDPRLLTVTVTDVRVAQNLRDAKVYVLVEGSEEEINSALAALRQAAPYIRKQLIFALNLKFAPALHFARDTVEERANRIESLLSEITQEERMKDEG